MVSTAALAATLAARVATWPLDTIKFYGDVTELSSESRYGGATMSQASLNAGLWASSKVPMPETTFAQNSRVGAMETVLNFSAPVSCSGAISSLPAGRVPSSGDPRVVLPVAEGLTSLDQCVAFCCTSMNCAAGVWTPQTATCATYAKGFVVTSAGHNAPPASAFALTTPPAASDHIANGLRSGTYLGGIGTGGYEIRADGSFHLSTIRNQSPASEPWQATVRDAVLAVSINSTPYLVRLAPFGTSNISTVPTLVYQDRLPIAKLSFLDMQLYAYSTLTPGDSNTSNTPVVLFTLHATNAAAVPVDITFMVINGFGLRNDWSQLRGSPAEPAPSADRANCAKACVDSETCLAWEWRSTPAAAPQSVASQNYTDLGNNDWTAGRILRNGNSEPLLPSVEACKTACTANLACITGLYVNGTVRHGECWLSSGTSVVPRHDFCGALPGQSCSGFRKISAGPQPPPGPPVPSPPPAPRPECLLSISPQSSKYTLGSYATGVDSGNPGLWTVVPGSSVKFTHRVVPSTQPYNGLGSQGLYFPAGGVCEQCSSGVGSGSSVEELLATLWSGRGLSGTAGKPFADGGPTNLFAAASITASAVAPQSNVSVTVAHAWHFPHFFWYRDSHGGSDNGVRYRNTYRDVDIIVPALNLSALAGNLVRWQQVYSGLPYLVLQDAAFNVFNHLRSGMWHADGEYRQWESFEFNDWSNPTNGDERHLNYFHVLPETMRSKELNEIAHAQNVDGEFNCVVVSQPGDNQWGADPCGRNGRHPDDVTMVMVGVYEHLVMNNDTELVAQVYPNLLKAFRYYVLTYNVSDWHLPYIVHETYDAVYETAAHQGEGNNGYSLYNAVNYLTGLHCMVEFARLQDDAATVAEALLMLEIASKSIDTHMWQPSKGYYIGDTVGTLPVLEANGDAYASSDGLHGQVLAYRLGFGDLLPRSKMQAHQNFVVDNLLTEWGLSFSRYSQQNWLMSDHANAALHLRWHSDDGWSTSLNQMRYFRDKKKENTRHTAVVSTLNGQYQLLNYYGYANFFYHTLSAFSGQTAHLPRRTIAFSPHRSAFNNSAATAVLPILLGGDLGTVTITATTAALEMQFLKSPLSFLNVTICQHSFAVPSTSPHVLRKGKALTLMLPSRCDTVTACTPGTYQSAQPVAVADRDNVCWPCPEGTFSDRSNAEECSPLSFCPPGEHVTAPSVPDPTQDVQCRPCDPGYFTDVSSSGSVTSCKKWATEPCPAEFVTVPGTATSDRVCQYLERQNNGPAGGPGDGQNSQVGANTSTIND